MNFIAGWDGTSWSPLSGPGGLNAAGAAGGVTATGGAPATSVWALGTFDSQLVAGGSFALTGGAANWDRAFYGPPSNSG